MHIYPVEEARCLRAVPSQRCVLQTHVQARGGQRTVSLAGLDGSSSALLLLCVGVRGFNSDFSLR